MEAVRSVGPEVVSPWRRSVPSSSPARSSEIGSGPACIDRAEVRGLSEARLGALPGQSSEAGQASESQPMRFSQVAGMALAAAATLCGPVAHAAAPSPASLASVTVTAPETHVGVVAEPPVQAPRLAFHEDGTFRIVQLTDIHFQPEAGPAYRERYDRLVGTVLDAEKPDLVVITGDVLYWSGRTLGEYFEPALAPVIERGIPFAYAAGNHDEEAVYTSEDVFHYLQARPLSLCDPGPKSLGAGGNYAVEVHGGDGAPKALVYLMDSHDHHARTLDYSRDLLPQLDGTHARPDFGELQEKYGPRAMEAWHAIARLDRSQMAQALQDGLELETPSGLKVSVTRDVFVPVENQGYDWLDAEQVRWYGSVSTEYTRQDHGVPLPSLMFFHIPLPEYAAVGSTPEKLAGHRLEGESVQGRNTGLFSAIQEKGDVMGVFAGHDHLNDYVGSMNDVALGYGRKTGLSVYGPEPMARGGRVLELHEGQRRFETWIRTEDGRVEDRIAVPDYFTGTASPHTESH